MKSIQIIKSEHLNLGAVLYSLEMLIKETDGGKQPDFRAFHGLLTYIDRFLDRFHHPKENEHLFPRLLQRAPDTAAVIRELGQQHRTGEVMFVDLLKALSAYEFGGEAGYPAFRQAVLGYVEFESRHAKLEDDEILPRAEQALTAEDWAAIDAAFGDNDDPLFGKRRRDEFAALFDSLVNTLPAPIGLGEVWK